MRQFDLSLLRSDRNSILGSSLHAKSPQYRTRCCCMVFRRPKFHSTDFWRRHRWHLDLILWRILQAKSTNSIMRSWCNWSVICSASSIFWTRIVKALHLLRLDAVVFWRIHLASSYRHHAYLSERVLAHLCQLSRKLVI